MPHRQFTDPHGTTWEVWDVQPEQFDATYDRRNGERFDRHKTPVSVNLAEGWLCFQSGPERRRFFPIPPRWHELPDGVLRVILEVSDPVKDAGAPPRDSAGGELSAAASGDVEEEDSPT